MQDRTVVGIIGATGQTGRSVVDGLIRSGTRFDVISLTRATSINNSANKALQDKGVKILGYDLEDSKENLANLLRGIDIVISCITWEHLEQQLPWIAAAKEAGVKRFVPSEWVGPAPRGVIDIKDKKLDVLGAIQRAHLPYTLIDVGCYFQVFVPKVPSGRSDLSHSIYIDHRIVGDGDQRFAVTDLNDIGTYVAQIIADPRTLNKHVLAYTQVLSMNEIWETMAQASGEIPERGNVSEAELNDIVADCKQKLEVSSETAHHPSNIMHTANYNMGQYRISWCVRGDNTPEYVEYLGGRDYWKLFPTSQKGKSLQTFFQTVLDGSS